MQVLDGAVLIRRSNDGSIERILAGPRQVQAVLWRDDGKQLVWTYGEELRFRTDKAGLIGGAEIKASSSLGGSNGAKAAMDGDLKTSWACLLYTSRCV